MNNLNKEKLIIFLLAVPLCIMPIFLYFLNNTFSASAEDEYKTETIYECRECSDCNCRDSVKKLISFKGPDADCESYQSEDDRMSCYFKNSHASYVCPDLEDSGALEDCYEKYKGSTFNYYQGGPGTLVANQSVTSNGSRAYFTGYDCNGEHVIRTGAEEPNNSVVTLREGSRDVEYGGDVNINGSLILESEQGGVYFGSDVDYSYDDLGHGLRGQTITNYENLNGLNLNRCLDLKVIANHNHLMTIPGKERTGGDAPNVGLEIETGLEVNGDLKAQFMWMQGRFLRWSEPIRGNWILYYNSPAVEPPGCTLPDYERDTPVTETPALVGTGEPGPGGYGATSGESDGDGQTDGEGDSEGDSGENSETEVDDESGGPGGV